MGMKGGFMSEEQSQEEEELDERFYSSIIIYFDEVGTPIVKLGDVHPLTAISLFRVLIDHLETIMPCPEIWHGEIQLDTFEFEDDEGEI